MFLLTICSWYVWSIYLYLGLINDLKVIDTEIKQYCLLLHRERFKLPQLTLENIGDTLLYMQFILIGTLPNITITFCFIFIITSSLIQGHKVQKTFGHESFCTGLGSSRFSLEKQLTTKFESAILGI